MTGNAEKQETFLPYELNYIPEDLQRRAKDELFEDEETKIHSFRLLRSMLRNEPDLDWPDDEFFLLLFLRARKFDLKRTFNLIKSSFTMIGKRVELFHNFNYEDVKRSYEENTVGILPYRDSDGCVIYLIRARYWDPRVNTCVDHLRSMTVGLLHALLSPATQIAGFKAIFDLEGLEISHLPYISPFYVWVFAEGIQSCFPARFKGAHVVNNNTVFSYLWAAAKPFLNKKIKDRFHFHGKNLKELHKYLSPSILPVEYGGELPHYDNTEWAKLVSGKADYFTQYFSYGYQKYKLKAQKKNVNHS